METMNENMTDEINNECPCKRVNCTRHGKCAECREHHRTQKRKILTSCERIKAKDERKRMKMYSTFLGTQQCI